MTASRFTHEKTVVRNPGPGPRVSAQRHQRARSCRCQSRRCTVFSSTKKISTLVGSERVIICCCFLVHPFCPRTVVSMCLYVIRQFHDQCDGNQCCPGFRGCLRSPFFCHPTDACARLLLLVTVHFATVPSPSGVEPAA